MIVSADPSHKTRKEWQDIDASLRRILDALESISAHGSTSMYAWLNSGKGFYRFREELRGGRT